MDKDNAGQLVAGALLAGAALLTGDVTLLATASGIGVNWTSEALGTLWQRLNAEPGAALAQAGRRAIRSAAEQLRRNYRQTVDPASDLKAFNLVRDSAGDVARAQYPSGAAGAVAVQRTLASALDDLLLGHDPRQVAFIKARLLEAVARAFRAELDADPDAWRAFHGRLIEQVASQPSALPRVQQVLDRLRDQEAALAALRDGDARLEHLLGELRAAIERMSSAPGEDGVSFENTGMRVGKTLNQAAQNLFVGAAPGAATAPTPPPGGRSRPVIFRNEDVEVQGDVNQAGGSIYVDTAHAQAGAAAANVGALSPAVVLAAFANAPDTAPLAWEREARALRSCLDPYHDRFRLELLLDCTPDDLHRALLRHQPQFFHFSGHGRGDGLLFEDGSGDSQRVPRAALVRMLANTPSLRCVVLNACDSAAHADRLNLGAPFLIAMRGPIAEEAARIFTQGFYDALAAGRTIPQAFAAGRDRLSIHAIGDADAPVLVQQG